MNVIDFLPFVGTVIGTFGGIVASAKLTTYRIEQLEKKVDKHNNLVERMYLAENNICLLQEKMKGKK